MIECKDLAGKVIRSITLFETGMYGAEVAIEFDDGTNFNACLGIKAKLEATWTRSDGGQPQLLKDYSAVSQPQHRDPL